jgi:hypothetical protein
MRARRRPLAIVLLFAYEALVGALLAWPATSWVRAMYGAHPDGDGPLWRPGALELFDMTARGQVFSALSAHATIVLVVGVVVGLLPMAMLVTSVAHTTFDRRPPPLRGVIARTAPTLVPLFVLLVIVTLVQLVILGLGLAASSAMAGAFTPRFGEARAQQIAAAALVVFLLLMAMIGVVHDLARTAAIRFEVGAWPATRLGLSAYRRATLGSSWSWGWRALVSWLVVAMAAFAAHRLGGHAGGALVFLTVLHQLVVLCRVALRASWLAKALRLVDGAPRLAGAALDRATG